MFNQCPAKGPLSSCAIANDRFVVEGPSPCSCFKSSFGFFEMALPGFKDIEPSPKPIETRQLR